MRKAGISQHNVFTGFQMKGCGNLVVYLAQIASFVLDINDKVGQTTKICVWGWPQNCMSRDILQSWTAKPTMWSLAPQESVGPFTLPRKTQTRSLHDYILWEMDVILYLSIVTWTQRCAKLRVIARQTCMITRNSRTFSRVNTPKTHRNSRFTPCEHVNTRDSLQKC